MTEEPAKPAVAIGSFSAAIFSANKIFADSSTST